MPTSFVHLQYTLVNRLPSRKLLYPTYLFDKITDTQSVYFCSFYFIIYKQLIDIYRLNLIMEVLDKCEAEGRLIYEKGKIFIIKVSTHWLSVDHYRLQCLHKIQQTDISENKSVLSFFQLFMQASYLLVICTCKYMIGSRDIC